jgi:prolyl-tRNA synthetase
VSGTRSSWARTGSASGGTFACVVEAHHDDKGIIWPEEVAPYAAHLVAIGANKEPRVTEVAERLHEVAQGAGYWRDILYDDRDESPGVKFTDAELLGMPWILTVSPRSLAPAASRSRIAPPGSARPGRSRRSRR